MDRVSSNGTHKRHREKAAYGWRECGNDGEKDQEGGGGGGRGEERNELLK